MAWRTAQYRRKMARRQSVGADRADGRLEHRPARDGRLGHVGVRQQHPRHRAGAFGVRGDRVVLCRRRPAVHPGEFTSGTTPSYASRAAKACGSISYLASPALAEKVIHAEIARTSGKTGKNRIGSPSDHAPVVIEVRWGFGSMRVRQLHPRRARRIRPSGPISQSPHRPSRRSPAHPRRGTSPASGPCRSAASQPSSRRCTAVTRRPVHDMAGRQIPHRSVHPRHADVGVAARCRPSGSRDPGVHLGSKSVVRVKLMRAVIEMRQALGCPIRRVDMRPPGPRPLSNSTTSCLCRAAVCAREARDTGADDLMRIGSARFHPIPRSCPPIPIPVADLHQHLADVGSGEQPVEGVDAGIPGPRKRSHRCTSFPSAPQRRRSANASSKRSHISSALNPCMVAVWRAG